MDFAVSADHRVKLKESKRRNKDLDFAREIQKLLNMKVTVIATVIGEIGTVTKGLEKGLEELEISARVETIQTTTLLRSA